MNSEELIKGMQECDLNGGLIGNCPYKGILALLKEQSEIVRCKDCKKRYTALCIQEEVGNINNQDDWFCADGERGKVGEV